MNVCIYCEKAYGGCSWTEVDPVTNKIRFEPVRGWTAEKAVIHSVRKDIPTYCVTACPEFLLDKEMTRFSETH